MKRNRFVGGPPPAEKREPTFQVLRVQKHGPLDLTLLSDTVRVVMTHWVWHEEECWGESKVCTQHEGECEYHRQTLEWTGWLPVYDHRQTKRAVLRLGPREADTMERVLGLDVDWAGLRVLLSPVNNGEGKLITVGRAESHQPPARFAPHRIDRTICAVLRCDHIPPQSAPIEPDDGPDFVPLPEGGA